MDTKELVNIPPLVWFEQMEVCLATQQVKTRPDVAEFKMKFGLFLDVEFPKARKCRTNKEKIKTLASILLKNNQVAFRTRESATNFLDYCKEELKLDISESEMTVSMRKKKVWVSSLPLGLPFERYQKILKIYLPLLDVPPFETCYILRIDPMFEGCSTRIRKRFREYNNLLNYEPTFRGLIVFVQILLLEGDPSDSFKGGIMQEKVKIEYFVNDINSKYSSTKWKPIVLFYGLPSQPELEPFYEDTKFMQSFGIDKTPSEKEFLLIKTDTNPSRLVFVPYFGCCSQMREANLMRSELPQLNEKLMSLMFLSEERKVENILKIRVEPVDFLEEYLMRGLLILADCVVSIELMESRPLTKDYLDKHLSYVLNYSHLTLAFDLAGTLIDRPKGTYHEVVMKPQIKEVIKRLRNSSKIDILIIGTETSEALLEKVNVDGIGYIGNLGSNIIHKDGSVWEEQVNRSQMNRKFDLINELHSKACKFGAYMSDRGGTLIFNSSVAPPIFGRSLVSMAREIAMSFGFPVHRWRSGLMIYLLPDMNKGRAIVKYLTDERGPTWMQQTHIIYTGDAIADEDAVKYIKKIAEVTMLRVTKGYFPKTQATVKLMDSSSLLTFLLWLEKNFLDQDL